MTKARGWGVAGREEGKLERILFFSRASLCECALAIRLVLVGISSAALKIWFHPLTNNSVYDDRQIQVAETRLVARLQRVFARPLFLI